MRAGMNAGMTAGMTATEPEHKTCAACMHESLRDMAFSLIGELSRSLRRPNL
jgi:hypothetical protein